MRRISLTQDRVSSSSFRNDQQQRSTMINARLLNQILFYPLAIPEQCIY